MGGLGRVVTLRPSSMFSKKECASRSTSPQALLPATESLFQRAEAGVLSVSTQMPGEGSPACPGSFAKMKANLYNQLPEKCLTACIHSAPGELRAAGQNGLTPVTKPHSGPAPGPGDSPELNPQPFCPSQPTSSWRGVAGIVSWTPEGWAGPCWEVVWAF